MQARSPSPRSRIGYADDGGIMTAVRLSRQFSISAGPTRGNSAPLIMASVRPLYQNKPCWMSQKEKRRRGALPVFEVERKTLPRHRVAAAAIPGEVEAGRHLPAKTGTQLFEGAGKPDGLQREQVHGSSASAGLLPLVQPVQFFVVAGARPVPDRLPSLVRGIDGRAEPCTSSMSQSRLRAGSVSR